MDLHRNIFRIITQNSGFSNFVDHTMQRFMAHYLTLIMIILIIQLMTADSVSTRPNEHLQQPSHKALMSQRQYLCVRVTTPRTLIIPKVKVGVSKLAFTKLYINSESSLHKCQFLVSKCKMRCFIILILALIFVLIFSLYTICRI